MTRFNGRGRLWMLAAPAGWFVGIPAAVPDTGPLNPHLVSVISASRTRCAGSASPGARKS